MPKPALLFTSAINAKIAMDKGFAKFILDSLRRYHSGDWGDLCDEDKAMNDRAVANGDDRIVAKYAHGDEAIYIITEWDRSATTVMFTYDY